MWIYREQEGFSKIYLPDIEWWWVIKKTLVYRCGNYCEALAERLLEEFGDSILHINISGGSIRIVVDNSKFGSSNIGSGIRDILSEFSGSRSGSGYSSSSRKRFSIKYIQKVSRKPVIPDLLSRVLNNMGYESVIEDNNLVTTADMETILEVVEKIAECLSELSFRNIASSAKKAIIYMCSTKNIDSSRAIEVLTDRNIVSVVDGRIVINDSLDKVLNIIDDLDDF